MLAIPRGSDHSLLALYQTIPTAGKIYSYLAFKLYSQSLDYHHHLSWITAVSSVKVGSRLKASLYA